MIPERLISFLFPVSAGISIDYPFFNQVFSTADGYIAVAVGTETLWKTFCSIIGRDDRNS